MESFMQRDFVPFQVDEALTDNRIVLITEEITESTAKTVIAKLLYLDSKSDDPIKIYIATPGGLVSAGLSIIDAMDMCKCKVDVYAIGQTCSMGFVILCAASGKRKMFKHAMLMCHELSSMCFGKITDLRINMEVSETMQSWLTDIIVNKTKITREYLAEHANKDMWFDAEKALEFGIVDELIEKK